MTSAVGSRTGCERCGLPHPKCVAHNRQNWPTGRPCMLNPMKGTTVCHKHGGKAPQVRRRAEARYRAQQLLAGAEVELIEDHVTLYRAMIAEAVGLKDIWIKVVRESAEGAVIDGQATRMVGEAIERVARLVSDFERLGLEERRVRLEEVQLEQLVAAIRGLLREHSVRLTDREIGEGLRKHLSERGSDLS